MLSRKGEGRGHVRAAPLLTGAGERGGGPWRRSALSAASGRRQLGLELREAQERERKERNDIRVWGRSGRQVFCPGEIHGGPSDLIRRPGAAQAAAGPTGGAGPAGPRERECGPRACKCWAAKLRPRLGCLFVQ